MWLKNRTYAVCGFSSEALDALVGLKCIKKVLSYDAEYRVAEVSLNKYQAIWFTYFVNFINSITRNVTSSPMFSIELSTL